MRTYLRWLWAKLWPRARWKRRLRGDLSMEQMIAEDCRLRQANLEAGRRLSDACRLAAERAYVQDILDYQERENHEQGR